MAESEYAAIDGWEPPTARERQTLLERTSTVAIVGASSKPARASNFVITYLKSSSNFRLLLVNPSETEILGLPVYPSLADLPETPDMVDVFRRPDDCPAIAEEAIGMGAQSIWLQLGIWSPEVARLAAAAGRSVVMDRCLKIEHARFHGGLHLAGFDTGLISSRRAR